MTNTSRVTTMTRTCCVALGCLLAAAALLSAADPRQALRVCADPDNLPFSNDRSEGFENRIAQIIAEDLHLPLQYEWYPQRNSFLRQTLNAGKCDVVIGVPAGWDPVLATKPYYASSYVFIYRKNQASTLSSFDDPALRKLKIGLHAFGNDGVNLPPARALGQRGLAANVVGFSLFPGEGESPSKIIDAVASGEIGVAVVWGPLGGYFAKRENTPLRVTPVSDASNLSLRFSYEISMGVRRTDTAWKEQLEGIIERRHKEILQVLSEYGVPVVSGAEVAKLEKELASVSRK
ncbi:MAG: substrate-binding domain-containing protein [Bryobacteraceae bacterium]